MDFQATLDYLYARLPVFQRVGGAAYKPGLERITALLDALGRPQDPYPSILIGGTNGKGSVSSMIASVLMAQGLKVGLYTSPHLKQFTERILINGQECDEQFVVAFVQGIRPLIDAIKPSFFEVTAAMAFAFFAEKKVDVAVVEVGMGGRLDATNVLQPAASIITNIGWDHMEFLGDTRAKIAAEKAGIIKSGSPAILGEKDPETKPVFQDTAARQQGWCLFAKDYFEVRSVHNDLIRQELEVTVRKPIALADLNGPFNEYHRPFTDLRPSPFQAPGEVMKVSTDLCGVYQADNLRTVLLSLACINQRLRHTFPPLTWEAIAQGLARVKDSTGLRGRMDVLSTHPLTLADVAHNPNGLKVLTDQLMTLGRRPLHIVFGVSGDKPLADMLPLLPTHAQYYWVKANGQRAMPAEQLAQEAANYGLVGRVYGPVAHGLVAAQKAGAAEHDAVVVVTGSIFVVAEVV